MKRDCLQITGIIARLIPFGIAVTIYFVDFIPIAHEAIGVILKFLPILCLAIFVLQQAVDCKPEYKWFCCYVLFGLIFGAIGDTLLYLGYFIEGALSFAVGHIFYSVAYGFKPIAWIAAVISYGLAIGLSIYLIPHLDGLITYGLPVYALVIVTMLWRSIARVYIKDDWSLARWITVFGAINFVVSDAFIAIDMFVEDVPNSHYIIMSTYYVAQFGMAMSTLDPRSPEKQCSPCKFLYC